MAYPTTRPFRLSPAATLGTGLPASLLMRPVRPQRTA
jgi:hypothetical protein